MVEHVFTRLFPVPQALSLRGGGIQITDDTLRFVRLARRGSRHDLAQFGAVPLPQGAVAQGEIANKAVLTQALASARRACGFSFACVSIPEQKGYLYDAQLQDDGTPLWEAVEVSLPEHIPLSPAESVYDCEVVARESGEHDSTVAVSALPEATALAYHECLSAAGFTALSLELEPQAALRAIAPQTLRDRGAFLMIDCGRSKTSLSVVQNGSVRFTTSTEAIVPAGASKEADLSTTHAITSAISRVLVFWRSQVKAGVRREKIAAGVVYGGAGVTPAFVDELARMTGLSCALADVQGALSGIVQSAVLPIPKKDLSAFAVAIGLSIRASGESL